MGIATQQLLQSKLFLASFNMAIFDGPFRLYFSQSQESEALRLYFELHEVLGDGIRPPRAGSNGDQALFVLLYPDEVTYGERFGNSGPSAEAWIGSNLVVGIRGPIWDSSTVRHVMSRIEDSFTDVPETRSIPAESHP